jgi:hypothetical protein
MGRSLPSLLLAIPTRYSRPKCMKTSETIEFSLDFSTGVMAERGKRYEWNQSRLEVGLFSEKGLSSL